MEETKELNEIIIIVQKKNNFIEVAIFEDGKFVRFDREDITSYGNFRKHSLFLGKFVNYAPSLNGVFINVGYHKNGFVPLEPREIECLRKSKKFIEETLNYKFSDKYARNDFPLSAGDPVIVKITREPLEDKGPTLSFGISVPGKSVVFLPFEEKIFFARGFFSKDEKEHFINVLRNKIKPGTGLIVRRYASQKSINQIFNEIKNLQEEWDHIANNLKNKIRNTPIQLSENITLAELIVREYFPCLPIKLYTNDSKLNQELLFAAEKYGVPIQKNVIFKENENIYKKLNLEGEVSRVFSPIVPFGNGAYLIVESTRTAHHIDVNAGSLVSNYSNVEEMALSVNLMAVEEIYRVITIRNLAGQIVIDFITMNNSTHEKMVESALKEAFAEEWGNYSMTHINEFGVLMMTRKKRKNFIETNKIPVCSLCDGTGVAPPLTTIPILLEDLIKKITSSNNLRYLKILVNPLLEAYLRYGFPSYYMKWIWKYKFFINLVSDDNLPINVFRFFTFDGREILPGLSYMASYQKNKINPNPKV